MLWLSPMTLGLPIAPGALIPALVTRALVDGALHFACSVLLSPLSAFASRDAVAISSPADFDAGAGHPTPIVLVHGLLGHPSNFRFLRRFLAARGFRNFATFSYVPRVDHDELARQLRRTVEAVCEVTGRAEVDIVGHSLGGLVARHLLERGEGARVRRLVTLGAPYLTDSRPEREFAIFAAADLIVPPPRHMRARSAIVSSCGHLGLLSHPSALRQVAMFLGESGEYRAEAARLPDAA